MRNTAWTSVDAETAGSTLFFINQDSSCLLAHRQGVYWARFNTGIVVALGAEMGKLRPGDEHEHPNPRSLRPDAFFVEKRAGYLAFSASTAL